MRVPKFLKMLMPIFVSLALLRSVNDAGPLSLNEVLVRLQSFEFSLDPVTNLLAEVYGFSFDSVQGALESTLAVIVGFFKMNWGLLKMVVVTIGDVFSLVLYVAGFTS